ncbi:MULTISPECIES: DNA methyltransferase [Rhizobium]|uniref:DNA methyltransferase n=1 Tax=Rhizobium TaxID=379 RepID=UPI001C8289BC|nr:MULTISPECIES: DNA methyltransferase [Rhizobium]MBX4888504.1 class I SAM-dependent DNA methyltransferase [Rhizobium bangladeshense]MBX5052885.1 class I SAM-dependent DNA methyltransferase [Rhizobium lentis]
MSEIVDRMKEFASYAMQLNDEKGQAQVFCERLFQAFGHKGYLEAGAKLEDRISKKGGKGKKFIDLIWKPVVLIEMKSAGQKLNLHYQQAFDYWIAAVPDRPRYVILCNFKEFWIYDFDKQLDEPVDRVKLEDLPQRYTALNFLFPNNPKPIFNNDREAVSREAADQMAELYRRLVSRPVDKVPREQAQRFVLQLLVAMFAEDVDLLPAATVIKIVNDCMENGQSAYDLFGGLFRQMDDKKPAKGGRFVGVPYFNGGLFNVVEPVDLGKVELDLIGAEETGAATKNWSKVNPAIFGTLFQDSMGKSKRHALGAHYTHEADIQRIVGPTIVTPWRERIDAATTMKQLLQLRLELSKVRVLDPACGSGNFLYVAYREMARLDLRIVQRIKDIVSPAEFAKQVRTLSLINPKQFFGIELDPFGADLAKVTLALAKELALEEAKITVNAQQGELGLEDQSLPLDNLDDNILCGDALFIDWPPADIIIGNPPYQSKNKLQAEMRPGYLNDLRNRFPEVDGRADYCTYWFRLAHDHLGDGCRAGLVGTNTIRQNYSRSASLDYIVNNGGTIIEAMSSMPWPGDANLHVSIVNWVKGVDTQSKRLFIQEGNRGKAKERVQEVEIISSSLSFDMDVTTARSIKLNSRGGCYQGQTHGHKSFLMPAEAARKAIASDKSGKLKDVLRPFLIADQLIGKKDPRPNRYVIDLKGLDILQAQGFGQIYKQLELGVLPKRQAAAAKEVERNQAILAKNPKAKTNKHHSNFLKQWWIMSYPREDMKRAIAPLSRYIVCGQVTKRPIFEFVSSSINPNAALMVFSYEDDYSFGILQSEAHWLWFVNRCSTLTERYRYTSNTVWDSFPWPQSPSANAVKKVAASAVDLRAIRATLLKKHNLSLRDLYRTLDLPGTNPLRNAHAKLDAAVREAYGMSPKQNMLGFLLALNSKVTADELSGKQIQGPGLPSSAGKKKYVSGDALQP